MSIKLKLSEQKDKGLHHAYVLVGEKESVLSELENFLGEDLDFEYRGHPDYFVFNYDSVNSDAAKEITSLASYSVRE